MKKFALLVAVRVMVFASLAAMAAPKPAVASGAIALLISTHTQDYFDIAYSAVCPDGQSLGPAEYQRYHMGWQYVLDRNGIPFTPINDGEINPGRLADFKVLILSNNFWLDDYQTKAISQWVRNGGHLLATYGTGYMGVVGDDFLKGGTNGLHQLWGDPASKLSSSAYLDPVPWVKVRTTQDAGPTAGFRVRTVIDYAWTANLLGKRPSNNRDINAFFHFCYNDCISSNPWGQSNSTGTLTSYPAILNNRHSAGQVVYYSFAPEYVISLAFDLAGHCSNDPRYPDGLPYSYLYPGYNPALSGNLMKLMLSTVNYLNQ